MPEVSSETQGKIIAYLALDGYNQGAVGDIQPIIMQWLETIMDSSGDPIFTLSKTRWQGKNAPLSGAASAKNAYKIAKQNGLSSISALAKEIKYAYGVEIKSGQTAPSRGLGTSTDDDGDRIPKRNIKADKFNYNGWAFYNIFNIAMGYQLPTEYLNSVNAVGSGGMYLTNFDVETNDWIFPDATPFPTLEDMQMDRGAVTGNIDIVSPGDTPSAVTPAEVFVPFVPSAASPGMKIKNPVEIDMAKFPTFTAPTPEEEISLSLKEWNRQKKEQGEGPYYDYSGEVLVTFAASTSDSAMQPITSVISSAGSSEATEDADNFMDDDDWGGDDESSSTETMEDSKWFLTPTIQFSFRRGADAYFRAVGDIYDGQMWPVSISDSAAPTRVTKVKVCWQQPVAGQPDEVNGFKISLEQDGIKKDIFVKDDEITEGFTLNNSKEGYNYLGSSNNEPAILDKSVVIYAHGVKGFGGLLNKTDNIEPADTLTWSDLNNSGSAGEYKGDVQISQAAQVGTVIRTQISRFYGNPNITDMSVFWKNWTESGNADSIMDPIKGGNNIIFNLEKEVSISADIKLYADTNPDYLREKSLKLNIIGEGTGSIWEVPTETDITGVISPTNGVWNQYVDFNCKSGKASEFFPNHNGQRFILPGDEQYLKFVGPNKEILNPERMANSIKYITYDKSSVRDLNGDKIVSGIKVAFVETVPDPQDDMEEIEEIRFLRIPDEESEFHAIDRNGEPVGGTIEGGLERPPDPMIMINTKSQLIGYDSLENLRRHEKQSPSYTIDKDNEIVTDSVAWIMGDQVYYIVATNDEGKSYLVKIDLKIPKR